MDLILSFLYIVFYTSLTKSCASYLLKSNCSAEADLCSDSTYGFQCSLEILYRLPNMMGRTLSMFSSMRLRMYSLFQKYSARSATCEHRDKTRRKTPTSGSDCNRLIEASLIYKITHETCIRGKKRHFQIHTICNCDDNGRCHSVQCELKLSDKHQYLYCMHKVAWKHWTFGKNHFKLYIKALMFGGEVDEKCEWKQAYNK